MIKKEVVLVLLVLFFPIVSADIVSINSGGDSQIVITPNENIEGFFFGNLVSSQSTSVTSSGGGGGGGGGNVTEFELAPGVIKIELTQGEVKKDNFVITNKLSSLLNVSSIKASREIKDFISFDEESVFLLSKESKKVGVNFFAQSNAAPKIYAGKITVKSKRTEKTINVIIEVKRKNALFDVTIDLDRKGYAPGETVTAKIDTINFGELKNIDVSVYYAVRDFEGNVFASKTETYAIENYRIQLVGKLELPKDIPMNDYIFYAEVSYENVTAAGSQTFTVNEIYLSPGLGLTFVYIVIAAVVLGIIAATIILYFRVNRKPPEMPQSTSFI